MTDTLVIDGRERVRGRQASAQTITPEQMETFFATLGETCNVVRSAKAAGFSSSWAYKLRQRDAAFRNGWAQAVREGYAKLELVLLERAMKGTPKPIMRRDGGERIIREYSTQLAVALLRRHAETADSAAYEPGEDEMRELRDKILGKLERVRERELLRDGATELIATGNRQALPSTDIPSTHSRRRSLEVVSAPLAFSESPSPDTGEGFERIETKAAVDRIGLIIWGLRRA